MNKEDIFTIFYGKEKRTIWHQFEDIESEIANDNSLYEDFDEIKNMLSDDKSYIRMRGFRIICKLAKWDKANKINNIVTSMLNVLDDDKPTIVRMCLATIEDLITYKKELLSDIERKLKSLNLSKYKDSMRPLIENDINNILEQLGDR